MTQEITQENVTQLFDTVLSEFEIDKEEVSSKSFSEAFDLHKDDYPKVTNAISKEDYSDVKSLSLQEQLILSCLLCIRLSEELENGITTSIQVITKVLNVLSVPIMIMSIKKFIGVIRLIKFDLDRDVMFTPILDRANDYLKHN